MKAVIEGLMALGLSREEAAKSVLILVRVQEASEWRHCHPSFGAAAALEAVAEYWAGLDGAPLTHGVEGVLSDGSGAASEGLTYLNRGDSYDLTLCFDSGRGRGGGWFVGSGTGWNLEGVSRRLRRR